MPLAYTNPWFSPETASGEEPRLRTRIDPIRGVDMQATVERILSAPPDVARRAKHLLE